MSRFRVLVTDYAWPTLDIERGLLAGVDAELIPLEPGEPEALIEPARDVDAILTCWRQIPPAALDSAPRCRIVSRYGIGLDNIPVDRATELGIVVTNVPDFCLEEVAEHTLALIFACARRLVPFVNATRHGEWNLHSAVGMPRLSQQTLGLVGYGNIARTVAAKARSLGMKVIAYTPRLAPDALSPWGRATTDLNELLAEADYVSLHVPLTESTRGLLDAAALRRMKPTAYLINTARGAVVDEAALYQALTEGWIAGAALDVLSSEPPPPDHPLLSLGNVIATPHAAFYSEPALIDLATRAARHVVQALSGQVPDNVVNPSVLDQANCRLHTHA